MARAGPVLVSPFSRTPPGSSLAKGKTIFSCSACGGQSPKWVGQCPECGAWNTLQEERAVAPARTRAGYAGCGPAEVIPLASVAAGPAPHLGSTGLAELDRVLGGGLVPGSVVLIGGDPGIGKSTLLLQALGRLGGEGTALYVSGEESPEQISLRARRLGLGAEDLLLLAETRLETILEAADRARPRVMVIDSIQTVHTDALQSAPGAVGQLRECTAQLTRHAKQSATALFLVGHVTKDGQLAGPRVLEHMVDTVLYFEGDAGNRYRVIRAVKNRFGAVNEIGVFAMTDSGLREVSNPSAIFLSRHPQPVSGSVVMVTREGTRPLLVEVQALVEPSPLGNPRRVTLGLEQNRLNMLLAVLHRHGGVAMGDQDVYVNVVGGVRVAETGADLAVVSAVLSSYRDRALDAELVVFGELGLAGEIRPVQSGPERLAAALKHGFRRAVVPAANVPKRGVAGLEIVPVTRLGEALELL